MVCTTFLHDSELNQVLPDPNVQTLLDEVRSLTGEDWQIVSTTIELKTKFWQKRKFLTLYSLCRYVGGLGPWQQLNFYSSPEEFSINTLVDIGTISNYLMGICNGFDSKNRQLRAAETATLD